MFAAIQSQNLRNPIVFGLGATEAAAIEDASRNAETLDELRVVPCSDELAAAVEAGRVDCVLDERGVAVPRPLDD